jgi:hypothetical protein
MDKKEFIDCKGKKLIVQGYCKYQKSYYRLSNPIFEFDLRIPAVTLTLRRFKKISCLPKPTRYVHEKQVVQLYVSQAFCFF